MKIGLVGAGLIGQERIKALIKIKNKINSLNFIGFFDESKEVSSKISEDHSITKFNSGDK